MPSTSTEATVTPRIILNTQIEDIESGIKRETAIVGEPLIWDIEGPGTNHDRMTYMCVQRRLRSALASAD